MGSNRSPSGTVVATSVSFTLALLKRSHLECARSAPSTSAGEQYGQRCQPPPPTSKAFNVRPGSRGHSNAGPRCGQRRRT